MNFLFPLLSTAANNTLSIVDGLIVALGGYGMVFAGLIALMVVVTIVGKLFSLEKAAKKAPEAAEPVQEVAEVEADTAPGTAGQLKLHDVSPKTAAMLMAIVADKMGKPLNELRFISIKEVK